METLFEQMSYWSWWILGVVLIVIEALVPGAIFLWMGVAAGVVGLLLLIFPGLGWEYQIMLFAVLSVAAIVVWRGYFRTQQVETDQPNLNRRGAQYVGRIFTLSEPISNGYGKIRVDDTSWKIAGNDCAAGERVKVNGVDGVVLTVERID